MHRHIANGSMGIRRASAIKKKLDISTPFRLRVEFLECLAALVALFPQEVRNVAPGPNRKVYDLLATGGLPGRMEWYFNCLRALHSLPREYHALLGSQTTPNEALHGELNNWMTRTQTIHHKATLELKLHVMETTKGLVHWTAMHRPTHRRLTQAELVVGAGARILWSDEEWAEWCSELHDTGAAAVSAAPLRLARQRVSDARLVHDAKAKAKAKAKARFTGKFNRTPLTRLRVKTSTK